VRVVVSEFISLDGVVQAPGGPDEDTSGEFRHGGWSMRYFDPEVMGPVIDEFADRSDAPLQGRPTCQVSAAAWPAPSATFAHWINGAQKYVVSDTLTEADVTSGRRRRSSAAPGCSRRCRRCATGRAATSTSTAACRGAHTTDRRADRRARAHDRADHAGQRQDPVPNRW
jgi:hypothetical protein